MINTVKQAIITFWAICAFVALIGIMVSLLDTYSIKYKCVDGIMYQGLGNDNVYIKTNTQCLEIK